jgi:hypothetical protein
MVEASRLADESPDGEGGCLVTHAGELQLWDLRRDQRVRAEALGNAETLVALDQGCLSLSDGRARLHLTADTSVLTDEATAIARGEAGHALVAAGSEIQIFASDSGERFRRLPSGSWVTVMLSLGEKLLMGFGDGGLEVLALTQEPRREPLTFEWLPASAPISLAAGPQRTLAAGFRNGIVGLWSLEDGSLIFRLRLHGPAHYLRFAGDHLHALTELGDLRSLDMSVMRLDDCALLRDLWRQVPVVWADGVLMRADPPAGHRCR